MLINNTKTPTTTNSGIDLSFFQRQIFYTLLFFIPWFVVPLPWDPTEQVRIILFIILSSILILLEVIKWIWDGKVVVFKSIYDKVFLLLLFSFILSSIFALDKWTAVWGFDGRLGMGLISMSILLIFFFLSRSFLDNIKYIVRSVETFVLGLSSLLVLSFLSLLKVNILGWLPVFKNFFVVGLPLTFYSNELIILSTALILMSIYLSVYYIREKTFEKILLPSISLIMGFLVMLVFSTNQGIALPVFIFIALLFTSLLLFIKLEKKLRFLPIILGILALLSTAFAIGLQYESFKDSLLGESFQAITPVQLASDISWSVSSKVMVEDFFRALVGLGNDSFAIAYNLFKPATEATISLTNVNFSSSASEFFTILATRGIVGVIVWILIGLVLLKSFINDLTSQEKGDLLLYILQILTITIYLSSFFLSFSFLLYFVFITLILLSLLTKNISSKNEEQFVLKFWAVNVGKVSSDVNRTISNVNWFLTVLVIVLVFAGLLTLGTKFLSVLYIARAEAFLSEESGKYTSEEEVTIEVREEFFNKLNSYYLKALRYDSSNPIANRMASTNTIEIMNILSEIYQKSSDEEKNTILSEISNLKNNAIELSREAINTSTFTYANWDARATVYMGLFSIGLSDYSEDALSALERCITLNPLDFKSYYRAGQIYMMDEEYEKALSAFEGGLRINGQHIPSLMLSASILMEKGDQETAISYLESAKKIMELNNLQDDPMYENVIRALKELGGPNTSPAEENPTEEDIEELLPQD
jgi:tetratricopeptide (TPR) repeat protein